jgi:hypothetical protein
VVKRMSKRMFESLPVGWISGHAGLAISRSSPIRPGV